MKYFEWLGNLDAGQIRFPDRQFNGYWMVEGESVVGWHEYLVAVYLSSATPVFDFGLATNAWPMFSQGMRECLERFGENSIQYLPFRFQRLDGTDQRVGYYVGQLLSLVDCLDRNKTHVRSNWNPANEWGDYDILWPFHLHRAAIGDSRLFRIKGQCRVIVIREDLKVAIENAGFSGQRFDQINCSD